MALFAIAVNYDLCATFRTIFIRMCLVHEQPVNAKLFKGYDIIFPVAVLQFFKPSL